MTVDLTQAERPSDQDLVDAIGELQRLTFSTVAGTTAAANIPVTGILTEDSLVAVLRLNRDATAANIDITDVKSEASISSNGNIQLASTDTSGDKLIVVWFNKH